MENVTVLDGLMAFFNALPNGLLYGLLGLSAFVENVFPPIPGDTITAFGAFLVGTRRLTFWGVYVSTTLGSVAGFMTLFRVGALLGRRFFIKKDYRLFTAENIIKAETWFQRYGYYLILLNRFFPGIRSIISLAGGISHLSLIRAVILATISAGAWNLIWIAVGYSLGNNWEVVKEKMTHILFEYNLFFAIILAVAAAFFTWWTFWRKRKS